MKKVYLFIIIFLFCFLDVVFANTKETINGVTFDIPSYFDVRKENYENKYDVAFYPKTTKAQATLGIKNLYEKFTSKQLRNSKNDIKTEWQKEMKKIKVSDKTIDGHYCLIGKNKDDKGNCSYCVIFSNNNDDGLMLQLFVDHDDTSKNPYEKDFDKLIRNLKFENSNKSNANSYNYTDNNKSGMRKQFKEAMDSYEKFVDEYISFMKKYSESGGTDMSLLLDYTSYMSKYADMCDRFSKWESEDLNTIEKSYYIEVQTRTVKKLLEASVS